jgi:RHS repeat-associated protein
VTYGYDAVGNRLAMTDTTGLTAYVYDALNRVTSITNPGSRVVSYSYDAAGNRTGVTSPDGKTVIYTYDDANRLIRVSDWASRQTNYTYDNVGNLTGQANPNNTSVSLTYDAANRLTGLINTSTVSGTVASFSYTLDKVGNRIRVVDTEGTTTYEYDKLYRLTAVTYPDATSAAYQYDPMGNRTVMTTTLGVTSYTYDAADRLLSAGPITFTWDADGNMLSKDAQTFTCDAANRLTQVISGTTTVDFAYDGDGRRANKTVNGTRTDYIYDTIAGLAYVLTEQTDGNTTLYTYGTDLIAQTAPDGTQSYYHPDGLGSTRALTSGNGQITARYSYDAFGAVRSASGSSSNVFRFAGEQTDDEIGLIYLRARYYDPQLGRFITKDPRAGHEDVTQSLNRYVYARNNPFNVTDPSGEDWLDWASWGLKGAAVVATGIALVAAAPVATVAAATAVLLAGASLIVDVHLMNREFEKYENEKDPVRRRQYEEDVKWGLAGMTFNAGLDVAGLGLGLGKGFDFVRSVLKLGTKAAETVRPTIQAPPRPTLYHELPSSTRSRSRLAAALGFQSYQAWSIRQVSQQAVTGANYEAYLSTTPVGRLLEQATAGPQAISQAEISGNYLPIARALRQAGFNPANPQSPPSGSK